MAYAYSSGARTDLRARDRPGITSISKLSYVDDKAALLIRRIYFEPTDVDSLNLYIILQFCFPYPELLRKRTARSSPRADEFVFVLSKAGEGSDESAVHRTFGFVRRALGPGPRGRLDCGARYPECFCLVTSRPLFSLFPSFLKMAHGIRLLDDAALPDFVARISAPQPIPLRGETFRVRAPFPSPGHCTPPPDLRFAMPAGSSSHM